MAGLAGFIDYDANGKPFIGLMMEDGTLSIKMYLGHKDNAPKICGDLTIMLGNLVNDLRKAQDRIVAVNGVIDNAAIRKPPESNRQRTG